MWEYRVYIAVTVVASFICIAIAASAFYMMMLWRRKKMKHHGSLCSSKSVDLELQQLSLSVRTTSEKKVSFESASQIDILDAHLLPTTPRKPQPLPAAVVESYTLEELTAATANFSSGNLIEGSVYHGRHNGKNLAIKRTNPGFISNIKFELFHDATHFHPNIIRVLGICTATDTSVAINPSQYKSAANLDAFLVFEYAENGSLKDWIHGGLAMKSQFIASCYCFLTWNHRLKICLDIAAGLQYMHQILNPCYVHRNIKSRNIFLDEEFGAKIGNFGMEECVKEESSSSEVEEELSSGYLHPSFVTIWDKGYIAPEYLTSGVINTSIDIYAFGVILLEMLSGKPPIGRSEPEKKDSGGGCLPEQIKMILGCDKGGEKLREWMDNVLGDNYSFEGAVILANLARACVDDDPWLRPNAGEVVEELSKLVAESPENEHFTASETSCKPLVVKSPAIQM